jgi:hypothetical protein
MKRERSRTIVFVRLASESSPTKCNDARRLSDLVDGCIEKWFVTQLGLIRERTYTLLHHESAEKAEDYEVVDPSATFLACVACQQA